MSCNISTLKPQIVWKHFAEICNIPHPSSHEEAIREYVVNFAKSQNLECRVDEANNVIVRKPATEGMEDRGVLILQAHLDMVPQKNNEKVFDFTKDSIEPYIDGEWVTADGTTLGADNGIGAAAILAVLESSDIRHGAIEALFTATEETGMYGAFGLQAGELQGDILLNLDSEAEGELYVGCAGGVDLNVIFKVEDVEVKGDYKSIEICVKGLKGGHSGVDIILGRANANKLLFRLLKLAKDKYGVQLSSVNGGDLRNAIPRESKAIVLVPTANESDLLAAVKAFETDVVAEYKGIEESISVEMNSVDTVEMMIASDSQSKLINAVCDAPNDVINMSRSMQGLVQTSSNLAIVSSSEGEVSVQCLLRSASDAEKASLAKDLSAVFESAGASVELTGAYSGWDPNMDSPILKAMGDSYEALYGTKPKVTAIHAGLECGIIGGNYPDMDMISFGPTICFPHSPDEKVEIESVAKFWDFLCNTLGNAPKR